MRTIYKAECVTDKDLHIIVMLICINVIPVWIVERRVRNMIKIACVINIGLLIINKRCCIF